MPAGTTVSFTATAGSIQGPSSYTWPSSNNNGGRAFSVSIKGATEPESGSLIISITTPSGVQTVFTPASIVVN